MIESAPMTVLHLVANRWWTGSADPVIRLATGLEARGHRVLLGLIRGDRFEAKARDAGLTPVAGLSLEVKFDPAGLLRDLARLRRVVKREGVDVVHTHHSHDHWLGALTRGQAALARTFHSLRAVRLAWPSTALYRRTDALLAVSRGIEERCRQAGVPSGCLHRVGGVADIARFLCAGDGTAIRREFSIGEGPVAGSVSRLAPNRGHELLIRAFRLLSDRQPRARLLLIGKGEARARLQSLVSQLGLQERVLFTGYRDADLPDVLASLDVFVLMGTGSDESCRAAIEAMAAGKPVVARRVGALSETVVHGRTGLLVEGEEPEAVAQALEGVLADPLRARAMGEAGRRLALEHFSPERHAAVVEGIYRQAIARRGTPA